MPTQSQTSEVSKVARHLLAVLADDRAGASTATEAGLSTALRRCTREQLLDFARQLGLKGATKGTKDALVDRVRASLSPHLPAGDAVEVAGAAVAADAQSVPARSKFDLGPEADGEALPANIPWGYGVDRVTAMAVDPRRLYVYWEVTDAAIAAARKALGAGGAGAWLSLRVYDITGRLFDGTNAHSYFDEGVSRDDRQWFFEIGKPTSTACIELGLKSAEGYFIKIARSGRVDFPREAPVGEGPVEWLTVRTATGHAGEPVVGGAPLPDGYGRDAGGASGGSLGGHSADDWQGWSDEAGFPVPGGVVRQTDGGWEWREVEGQTLASELGAVEWSGPVHRSEWQAGPFAFPVDAPTMLEQHESGEVSVSVHDGVAHVVYGPWQVVIRGTGARAERRVLATWELRRTIAVAGGFETYGEGEPGSAGRWEPIFPGASEHRFVPGGASERRWVGASELLVRGGSEVYMVGASERRFRGASERLFTGASERRFRGASERLQRGASERRLGGASERTFEGREAARVGGLGASENSTRAVGVTDDATASSYPTPTKQEQEKESLMAIGYFSLVLHAHLPFVRHPEDPTVMEEQWLYEAITGTYLPLLQVFDGLVRDHIPFRCTVSLSAPLIAMLTDDLLKVRYAAHLDKLIELAEKEIDRTKPEPHYHRLAHMYNDRFRALREIWRGHDGDLVRAFKWLQAAGRIEVITSTATHAFFPLLDCNWASIRAQVHVAADLYERHFGQRPRGMWLGECGYVPGIDELLREAAVRYFFVDTHGILFADRRPAYGVHAPIYCPSGVAAFGRDLESSEQVWSAKEGYPGDKHYRDFYRDIGFDLPMDYIKPYIHPEGHRMYTGIKYHAITHDQLHDKWVYDPEIARGKAGLHASHFRGNREKQARRLRAEMDRPPLIVSPYDAELYGHWWYEGPMFLDNLFRQIHFDQDAIETLTPGDYLDRHPTNQVATPSASSWGLKGYGEYWLNETNAWTYRHLHVAGERMIELSRQHPAADPLTRRALNQAARELMLAQSSDWTFIMKTGTTVPYATRRINEHVLQFTKLYDDVKAAKIDEHWLAGVESRNNIFPNIDYRIYAS